MNQYAVNKENVFLKSCYLGKCINDSSAPVGDCLFGDDVLVNNTVIQDFDLPSIQMNCEDFMEFAYQKNKSGIAYCFSNHMFNKTCCETCKSIVYFSSI